MADTRSRSGRRVPRNVPTLPALPLWPDEAPPFREVWSRIDFLTASSSSQPGMENCSLQVCQGRVSHPQWYPQRLGNLGYRSADTKTHQSVDAFPVPLSAGSQNLG